MPSSNYTEVLVIGAGSAGLAAAAQLKRRGIPVRILERAPHVGDAWRKRHPGLRLNTHRTLSGLPGMAMPPTDGAFPGRDTVIRFLEEYANQLDVDIRFRTDVSSVKPDGDQWTVTTNQGEFHARHVIIATGYDRVPWIPETPDLNKFAGVRKHAAHFGDVSQYRNRKILVIGAGNSGTDVLNHLSRIETGQVWVSVRHGPVIFPTRLLGVPVQLLSPVLEKLPAMVVDVLLALTERIAFGNLSKYGLPKHPDGGATRLLRDGIAPGIDNGFVRALKKGRAEVVPRVSGSDHTRVRLADGRRIDPDVVIYATGYRTGLESMLGDLDVLDPAGVPFYRGAEQDPENPGLWFIGMRPVLSGFFRTVGHEAESIAQEISKQAGFTARATRERGNTVQGVPGLET